MLFFFSSRRRHTRWPRDWSSDVCSSDLRDLAVVLVFICPETVHYLKTLRPILKEKIVKAAEGFESFKVLSIERESEVRYLPSLSVSHIVSGVMLMIMYLPIYQHI